MTEPVLLAFGDREHTRSELDALTSGMAAVLEQRGVRAGDRVALMSSNRPEFVVAMRAIWGVGAAVVLLSSAWKRAEVEHALALTAPAHAVGDHPVLAGIWGPLVGPIVAVVSFVCSIGNVPLAAVLWNGGISFGGVVAFIFADLIILPILNIYRKYYGWRMAGFILVTFYATMVLAGYVVEVLFQVLHLVPTERNATVLEPHISWNYTTWLNIVFLVLAAALLVRFFTSGGTAMLRHMGGAPERHPGG